MLVSAARYSELLDRIENLEDSIAAFKAADEPTIPAEEVFAALGL